MPVLSVETQNAILDGWLGTTRAAGAPDEYQVEGWVDDPRSDGAGQADFDGYTPATWDSDDWLAAAGGSKSTDGLVSLGTPAGEGSDAIRFWALRNTTSDELAFSGRLDRPVFVSASANPVRIRPTVFWPTN